MQHTEANTIEQKIVFKTNQRKTNFVFKAFDIKSV